MDRQSDVAIRVTPKSLTTQAASVVAGAIVAAGVGLSLPAQARADITPNHDSMITTNACEDILLGWSDGQILDNLSNRYGVSSQEALQVITEMRMPGNCEYDENF